MTVDALDPAVVREALRLLGAEAPAGRAAAQRALRDAFAGSGAVRALLERAPAGAREAFVRLAADGPAAVEDLIGRGWWGRGALPPPLDWLQRRALVAVGPDGLVAAVDEARASFRSLTLGLADLADLADPDDPDVELAPEPPIPILTVEGVTSVVVAGAASVLDRALAVAAARLRAVAPTVAVSDRSPTAVTAALRGAGLPIGTELVVPAASAEPALPGTAEEAVGPRAIRALLERAVTEERQIHLRYFASSRGGAATERTVDPWSFSDDLLRGWCHLRTDERTFALDRVGRARLLPSPLDHRPPRG